MQNLIKILFLASKEYDPDKHCGVVVEQTDPISGIKTLSEPCTRSLTCKVYNSFVFKKNFISNFKILI